MPTADVKLSHGLVNPLLWAFYPDDNQPEQLDFILGPFEASKQCFRKPPTRCAVRYPSPLSFPWSPGPSLLTYNVEGFPSLIHVHLSGATSKTSLPVLLCSHSPLSFPSDPDP